MSSRQLSASLLRVNWDKEQILTSRSNCACKCIGCVRFWAFTCLFFIPSSTLPVLLPLSSH